jgi:hypothetical protein
MIPAGVNAVKVSFDNRERGFLRNPHQLTAFEQAELILYAALDSAIASKARKGDFVNALDHFNLLQSPIN